MVPERESTELVARVVGRQLVASGLVRGELPRAARRVPGLDAAGLEQAELQQAVRQTLVGLALAPVDDRLLDDAAALGPASLRSLDAIHLATALLVRDRVEAFVVYDRRLAQAARDAGLAVESPGAA